MLESNKYKPLKKQKLMEKGKRRSEGLATMAGFLMVLAAMLLTACDGLLPKGGGSQGWETEETEEPSEEKSSLPPIGSVVMRNVVYDQMEREEDIESDMEDVLPILGVPYESENGAVWTFSESDEEGVLNATLTDPDRGRGKLQEFVLKQYASCAYDVYPKSRDISTGIIRVKNDGGAVEEDRGGHRVLFAAGNEE